MYWKFYGLREDPFGLTPDRRFLYLTESHSDALANLRESLEAERGFAAVVSQPGLGKTTLLFQLLEEIRRSAVTAFVFQTTFEPIDILRLLWKELGLDASQTDLVKLHQQFQDGLAHVASLGKQFVLVIDEAQSLSPAALETIRLLSNFETYRKKMVQIVLAGHPELEELLARHGMEHIKQRIAVYCRLKPFTLEETQQYVAHRLTTAGHEGAPIFAADAIEALAQLSKGVPRTINIYAFQALMKGSKKGVRTIDALWLRRAVHQFEGWPEPDEDISDEPIAAAPMPAPPVAIAHDFREPARSAVASSSSESETDAFVPPPDNDQELRELLNSIRADRGRPPITSVQAPSVVAPMPPAAPRFDVAASSAAAAPATKIETPLATASPVQLDSPIEQPVETTLATVTPFPSPIKAPTLVPPRPATPIAAPAQPEPSTVNAVAAGQPAPPLFRVSVPAWLTQFPWALPWPDAPVRRIATAALALAIVVTLLVLARDPRLASLTASRNTPATVAATPPGPASGAAAPTASANAAAAPASTLIASTTNPSAAAAKPQPAVLRTASQPLAEEESVAEVASGSRLPVRAATANDISLPVPELALPPTAASLGSAIANRADNVTLQPRQSQITPVTVVTRTRPDYPAMAKQLGVAGEVVLRVSVAADGRATRVEVISGPQMLRASAENAVRSFWRFKPATLDGRPVEGESEVRIMYKLAGR